MTDVADTCAAPCANLHLDKTLSGYYVILPHSTQLIHSSCFSTSLSSVAITSPHLQVSPRFLARLTQPPTRTAVKVWLWLPSFLGQSHSRAVGLVLPAPQQEEDGKVEVSRWSPAGLLPSFGFRLDTFLFSDKHFSVITTTPTDKKKNKKKKRFLCSYLKWTLTQERTCKLYLNFSFANRNPK